MPEYLAPGVFVEETSFRQKTLEGVSTSTTGFIGSTRFGPLQGEPSLLTSFSEFERIYGGIDQLEYREEETSHNYLAHAVRGFFDEGGKRLYVARAFSPERDAAGDVSDDGVAQWAFDLPSETTLSARYPGDAGNVSVTLRFKLGENLLLREGDELASPPVPFTPPRLQGVRSFDVVVASHLSSPSEVNTYWLERVIGVPNTDFRLRGTGSPSEDPSLEELGEVRLLTLSILLSSMGRFGEQLVWENLALDPRHKTSLTAVFAETPAKVSTALYVPLVFNSSLGDGAAIAELLLNEAHIVPDLTNPPSPPSTVIDEIETFFLQSHTPIESSPPTDSINPSPLSANQLSFQVTLEGGNDGNRPVLTAYQGDEDDSSGLKAFEDLEDISIIAAPGSSHRDNGNTADQVRRELIKHCEFMRYRVAVLDSRNEAVLSEVKQTRASLDTTRATLYYPWIRVYDPVTETEIMQPPSGYISGIYARNDVEFGVHKSPANEVIRSALGFEFLINKAQQEVLNPEGINCLRFFEGRGFRVWGARTLSSDPEWKYLNVRRYFAFLERTIEKGTQWAVFENNGDVLWANIRNTVEDFLFNEWKENHLFGTTPKEAYFVRCDRTTMTQNDIDNGRMICLIGVSPLRPAEFVIFRIGQKTADAA